MEFGQARRWRVLNIGQTIEGESFPAPRKHGLNQQDEQPADERRAKRDNGQPVDCAVYAGTQPGKNRILRTSCHARH